MRVRFEIAAAACYVNDILKLRLHILEHLPMYTKSTQLLKYIMKAEFIKHRN